MKVRLLLFFLFTIGGQIQSFAQCAVIDFSISPAVCLNERTVVEDTGLASLRDWDFCSGDFSQTPSAQLDYTLSAALGRPGIEFAKDGNLWYAFVTGTWASTLYRVQFANGLNNAPTSVDNLGDLGGKLIGPGQVRVMKEGNEWFGLIHNAGSPGGELLKLSFGDKLSNSILVTTLASGLTNLNSGLAVGRDETNGWVCVLTSSINQFTIIKLGFNLSAPLPSDIVNSVTVPDPNNLGDVDLIKECNEWFGFATNLGNGNLYRLKFGTQLFSAPTIDKLAGTDVVNGGRLRIVKEGTEFFLLSTSLGGAFYKTSFGSDLNNPTPVIVNEGSFGTILQNSYGLGVAKENSVWNVSVIDQGTGKISRVNYSPFCPAIVDNANVAKPIVHYSQPGIYSITLTKRVTGNSVSISKNVTVSNSDAPEIAFITQNSCAQHGVLFQSQGNPAIITNYDWDFGDTNTSLQSNPTHLYAAAGGYEAILKVVSNNGCKNLVKNSVTMYNKPMADFTLPTANPFCTNQIYTFVNASAFDLLSNPVWTWSLNGTQLSSTSNLSTQLSIGSPQQVKLRASIPGCESEITKTISTVQSGPLADFTFSNGCQAAPVSFTNTTAGVVTNYSWNFEDGNTSQSENPTNIFQNAGTYRVTLSTSNASGCQNFITKSIIVYSKPVVDFSIELPPFSCAGSLSQFTNLTPAPTDSNITTWTWGFGDAANGLSSVKNPSYTYTTANTYNVSLAVTTNFGCTNSIQKSITISPSPVADFFNLPACVNQATQFTDASTGSIKSRLWQIQSNTFSTANPRYTFPASGSFPILLTVTGNNNCVSQASKNIVVPVVPPLDFSVQAPCANSPSVFTELTTSTDPSISKSWSFGSQGTGSGSPVQYAFTSIGTYPVLLNSTRQSGCVYSVSKNVSIVSPPIADFAPSIEDGAVPLPVSFANTSSRASSYLWKFGDQGNSTSVLVSPTFVFSELGVYNVELSASNLVGCTSRLTKPISVVIPNVDAEMTDFFFVKDTKTGSLQPVVKLLNRSNITLTNPTILLDVAGGSGVSQQITATVKPNQEISQMLDLKLVPKTNQYVCAEVVVAGDSDTFLNRKCLSLSGEEVLFTPFPNPAREQLNMDWISIDGSAVTFQVLTTAGAVLFQQTISSINLGLNRLIINTSTLLSGIYFIRFRDGKTDQTFSFAVLDN
ncbi:MAG: PKD domain-containing protein [Cyclobacteriaceae bacterium]|nr:PKD domain-containing protein [Cyclobacteriaceae bacterium]